MKNIVNVSELDFALELVAKRFGLRDFVVTKFDDGANKCKVTLSDPQFEVQVTIKSKHEFMFPSTLPKDKGEELENTESESEEESEN